MAYTGQPFESNVYHAARAKISDGKSVRVKSGSVEVEAGKFYFLEGFLGAAMTSAAAADEDKEVTLNIEPAEYETDQIKADEKGSMTVGASIYWDDTAGAKHFTVTATAIYAGKITAAAGEGSVIWFKLAERPFAVDNVTTLSTHVGDIATLSTTDKSSVVAAVNEVVDDTIGDLATLDPAPATASTVVGVFNEKVAENVAVIVDADQMKAEAADIIIIAEKVNDLIEKLVAAKLMAAGD